MKTLKLAMIIVVAAVTLTGVMSCGWWDDCGAQMYCVRGSVAAGNCQIIQVCNACAYDEDCCYGFDNPNCGIEPYPY
ncbi:MAG: hypothetical protein WC889_11415 [Myxococcota bacterium]